MKKSLYKYLMWITLTFLLILLFVQIRWIVYSIQLQEKVFNNCIDLALEKTISGLNKDKHLCNIMQSCATMDIPVLGEQLLSQGVWKKIQKTLDAELSEFDISLDYNLFITKDNVDTLRHSPSAACGKQSVHYTQSLREMLQANGYELVVQLPMKSHFLPRRAAVMIAASILLIMLIFASIIQLIRLYKNELQLSQNIRELINNVTHEFKTPMSSIALASNLMRKGKLDSNPEKLKEYSNLIFNENQKLQRQIEELLDLAAIEWNEFEYRKDWIGLNELANDAARTISLLVEEKKGKLTVELNAVNDNVFADKIHFTNAIVNLLTNAVKYSEAPPDITLRTYEENKNLILEVEDKGIGIPAKYQKHIFDKYYRVPTGNVHNIKGFGIGLSYVKNVVEAHKGKIEVQSEPGKGSIFRIILKN